MSAGKRILITGASLGIGKETALILAEEGHTLFITYNEHKQEGKKVAKECRKRGAKKVELFKLDLQRDQDIKNLSEKIPKIDWLINNAGIYVPKKILDKSSREIRKELRVNLEGPVLLTQKILPKVQVGVINVSSRQGKKATLEEVTIYCASKFGIRGFTQGMAIDYPKLKWYCFNPAYTATRMTDFEGTHPREVAKIIHDTIVGKYNVPNGGDIDVADILDSKKK